MSTRNVMASRRNWVRVWVTYGAAIYVFVGSTLLIIGALWTKSLDAAKMSSAKEIFTMTLPVATGIITYWFASRRPENDLPEKEGAEDDR